MQLMNQFARKSYVGAKHIPEAYRSPLVFLASLGNPEPQYSFTRHNIGHRFINELVEIYWRDHIRQENGYYTSTKYPNIILFKDTEAYMNRQGRPIWNHYSKTRFKHYKLFIVHDDLQTSVGKYKIYTKGTSTHGHNGLKSVIQFFGNTHTRYAIGIGQPPPSRLLSQWVRGRFKPEELQTIDNDVIPTMVRELENLIQPKNDRKLKH